MAKKKESGLAGVKPEWNVSTGVDSISASFSDTVPTENRYIDYLIGGGILRGRINEFYGREGCGKTTLALQVCKKFQESDGSIYWITSEAAWDKVRAESLGVDPTKVIVAVPEALEDGFEFVLYIINKIKAENQKNTLIVWDGINAAASRKVIESESFLAGGVAEKARLIAEFLRIITVPLTKHDITFIVNNHVMNAISNGPFGKEYVNPGGNVLKHLVSMRLYMDWKARKEENQTVKLVLEKTRNKEPNTKAEVLMSYFYGFHEAYQTAEMGIDLELLRRYRGQLKLVEGDKSYDSIQEFYEDKEIYEKIFEKTFEQFKNSL
jgi:RecA/RadA recombinase